MMEDDQRFIRGGRNLEQIANQDQIGTSTAGRRLDRGDLHHRGLFINDHHIPVLPQQVGREKHSFTLLC